MKKDFDFDGFLQGETTSCGGEMRPGTSILWEDTLTNGRKFVHGEGFELPLLSTAEAIQGFDPAKPMWLGRRSKNGGRLKSVELTPCQLDVKAVLRCVREEARKALAQAQESGIENIDPKDSHHGTLGERAQRALTTAKLGSAVYQTSILVGGLAFWQERPRHNDAKANARMFAMQRFAKKVAKVFEAKVRVSYSS